MKKILAIVLALLMLLPTVACGDSSHVDAQNASKAEDSSSDDSKTTSNEVPTDVAAGSTNVDSINEEQLDGRGIPGMKAFPIEMLLTSSPFNVAIPEEKPADPADGTRAAYCNSSGEGDDIYAGILYDYSFSLDSDGEIIGATFGVSGTDASEHMIQNAADLYFYAVAISDYDTADPDTLSAWFKDNLPSVDSSGVSTTIGDASFTLYGTPLSYWVDISKSAQ